ncbi:sporulation integral membrane protein YtvI [Thermovenabulum gondwanense]|uniref:Sporulation integral membrane protein YtvI n=1 Tax=Thermovenabulum gondwanense TaxID=520767 RepID=A0A162MGB2_9FIRM|nr:sporulation integral membrane protein YtvI [Thermovenabulum gondwanense]KYO65778.1 hypothetical protein ATZ99_14160 [Thermovenabulum gondwanense]
MVLKNEYKPLLYLGISIIIATIIVTLTIRYLLPFVFGVIIAFLIEPLVKFAERLNIKRTYSSLIILLGIFTLIIYIIILSISRITVELGKLVTILPNYYNLIYELWNKFNLALYNISKYIPKETLDYLNNNWDQVISYVSTYISNFYSFLLNKLVLIPGVIVFLIFTFLASYFFSKDKQKILDTFKRILPTSLHKKLENIQIELFLSFIGLIKAQIILVIISTAITIAGFYILKVDYALTLGLICGLLDILPLFGPSLIFIPWILYLILTGSVSFAVYILTIYLVVIGTRQILQAKVIGSNLGLDPTLALIAIYLGIKIFGFLGLFLGPLIAVIIRAAVHSGLIPPLSKK